MARRWLSLRLDAPLMAFGGLSVDHLGPVRDFPSLSMLVGLIANALGWRWNEADKHDRLQERLLFASRHERGGVLITDAQNARIAKGDKAWTTRGVPEERAGGDRTYLAPHRRYRDYHADLSVGVVLRMLGEKGGPSIDAIADALESPARPLFLGRKACLPSKPILAPAPDRWVTADNAFEALRALPSQGPGLLRAQWPARHGPEAGPEVDRIVDLPDLRSWRTGVHRGSRVVVEGWVRPLEAA